MSVSITVFRLKMTQRSRSFSNSSLSIRDVVKCIYLMQSGSCILTGYFNSVPSSFLFFAARCASLVFLPVPAPGSPACNEIDRSLSDH